MSIKTKARPEGSHANSEPATLAQQLEQKVVTRLRSGKDSLAGYLESKGKAVGRTWALEHAEYREMVTFMDVAEGEASRQQWSVLQWCAYDLRHAYDGLSDTDKLLLKDEHHDLLFGKAVLAGAMEVFEAVRKLL